MSWEIDVAQIWMQYLSQQQITIATEIENGNGVGW